MDYNDLKGKTTREIKACLFSMDESMGDVKPLISICMTLCDRIAGLEEQVQALNTDAPQKEKITCPVPGQDEKTATLKDQVRAAARIAEKEDPSGHFNPMSWLDLELEDHPDSFDKFFDTPWHELSDSRRDQRAMAVRRVL